MKHGLFGTAIASQTVNLSQTGGELCVMKERFHPYYLPQGLFRYIAIDYIPPPPPFCQILLFPFPFCTYSGVSYFVLNHKEVLRRQGSGLTGLVIS